MSRNEKKLREALAAIGYEPEAIRWEPIGPMYEMCGHSGGWFVDDMPIGLSIGEALAFVRDCPGAFRQ